MPLNTLDVVQFCDGSCTMCKIIGAPTTQLVYIFPFILLTISEELKPNQSLNLAEKKKLKPAGRDNFSTLEKKFQKASTDQLITI